MATLLDLLNGLHQLGVEPSEIRLAHHTYTDLLARAREIVDEDDEDSDVDEDD